MKVTCMNTGVLLAVNEVFVFFSVYNSKSITLTLNTT